MTEMIIKNGSAPSINSVLQSRRAISTKAGQQFGGDRDIYSAAGYRTDIEFEDYYAVYKRGDIAKRIVSLPAASTWQQPPTILDGDEGDTEFTKAWAELTSIDPSDIADQKTIWHYLERADRISGIGRFGVLVIGVNQPVEQNESGVDNPQLLDGDILSMPLPENLGGVEDFLYLHAYDEGCVEINSLIADPTNKRFNLPEFYSIEIANSINGNSHTLRRVHWSRVIHIAEGLDSDELYGAPRLEAIFNRRDDLEKILAGGSEAAWKLMDKGIIVSTKDGYELAEGEVAKSELENFIHGLTRVAELEGVDVNILGGEMVDPTGIFNTLISVIAGATGIPQRRLLGNEQGQLASTQDERNWADIIESRQKNFAEPILLRPLISRLIYCGVLPQPSSGGFQVEWADSFSLNEIEAAQRESAQATALSSAVSSGMPIETYLREYRNWDDTKIEEMYAAKEREESFGFRDTVTGIEQ